MNINAPTTDHPLEYCRAYARRYAYAEYMAVLHCPLRDRGKLFALLAFEVELRQVKEKVSEEMIAHIRYAWWREALEEIREDKPVRAHPVLQGLHIAFTENPSRLNELETVIQRYQECYPELLPPGELAVYEPLLESIKHPKARRKVKRALNIVSNHRRNYGSKHRLRLTLRLIFFA